MRTFLFALLVTAGSIANADVTKVRCKDMTLQCDGSACGWKIFGNERIYDVTMLPGPLGEKAGIWMGTLERMIKGDYKQTLTISQIRSKKPIWNHYIDSTIEVDSAKISTQGEYHVITEYISDKTKAAFRTECYLGIENGVAGIDLVM